MRLALSIRATTRTMALLALASLWLHLANVTSASAAMRQCAEPVAGSGQHPSDEMAARKEAIVGWSQAAKALGEGYLRWQLAHNRSLECARGIGGYVCQAIGEPCVITQMPGKPRQSPPSQAPSSAKQI